MKTYTALGNTVSQDLMFAFANLVCVGWGPEVIKHKLDLSSEVLESIHDIYFNPVNGFVRR